MVDDPSFDENYIQQIRLKAYVDRVNVLKENCVKVYGLIWGQCTNALQAVIKGDDDYRHNANSHDLIWLLEKIKQVTSDMTSRQILTILSSRRFLT